MAWIIAHQAICAGLVVAVLDFVVGAVPSLAGNNIIHQVIVFLSAKKDA